MFRRQFGPRLLAKAKEKNVAEGQVRTSEIRVAANSLLIGFNCFIRPALRLHETPEIQMRSDKAGVEA